MKETRVEPTSAPRTDSKWATLIPAIAVPVVVVLFLIFAFLWTRYAAKRKREQKKVEPLKVIRFISLSSVVRSRKQRCGVVSALQSTGFLVQVRAQLKDG